MQTLPPFAVVMHFVGDVTLRLHPLSLLSTLKQQDLPLHVKTSFFASVFVLQLLLHAAPVIDRIKKTNVKIQIVLSMIFRIITSPYFILHVFVVLF
jgi:hypothetical protein